MAKMTSIRFSDDEVAIIEAAAKRRGLTIAELVRQGALVWAGLSDATVERIRKDADRWGATLTRNIEGRLMNALATEAAGFAVLSGAPQFREDLAADGQGPLVGDELYDFLFKLRKQDEAKRRERQLAEVGKYLDRDGDK